MKSNLEGFGRYTYEILRRLVESHPEVQFSFFFDRPYDKKYIFGKNVTAYVLYPPARHVYLIKFWFDYSVKYYLNKLKPDLFFSTDGFISTNSKTPQITVIHDLAFEHYPNDISKLMLEFYKKRYPESSKNAKKIFTVSEFTKQDIVKKYKISEEKIIVTYNAADEKFHPISEEEKQAIRDRFTNSEDYFHFVGAIQPRKNLVRLFKAFDIFKQETNSKYKLLIVGRKAWNFTEITETFEQMQFKNDVIFTGYVSNEDLVKIYGASTALCYIPYFEGFGLPIVEAFSCETAVITSNVSSMPEVAGKAAICVNPFDEKDIAKAMGKISSDKNFRDELIKNGKTELKRFSWDKTADKIWQEFENTINSQK